MLRATVRLGRTVVRPDHPAEYAVALDGEIPFGPDDPEGVLEKVAELFHLADEALAREVDRDRDPSPAPAADASPQRPATLAKPKTPSPTPPEPRSDAATPKQVRYLLNLAKRNGLSRDELDAVVARVTGSPKKTGELTRRDAGIVIDHLTTLEPETAT